MLLHDSLEKTYICTSPFIIYYIHMHLIVNYSILYYNKLFSVLYIL